MTDSIQLKRGELYVTADGSVVRSSRFHDDCRILTVTPDQWRVNGWESADAQAAHLVGNGYTRVYPESIQFPSGRTYSTEGSAIKEVAPAEVKRAPLTNSDAWRYTDKRVDRWAGFVVDKMDINMPCDPWKNNRHSLQRMSEGTNPTHGSALLLKD